MNPTTAHGEPWKCGPRPKSATRRRVLALVSGALDGIGSRDVATKIGVAEPSARRHLTALVVAGELAYRDGRYWPAVESERWWAGLSPAERKASIHLSHQKAG